MPDRTDELIALLQLDRLPGVGPRTTGRLVRRFGDARRALAARRAEFEALAGGKAEAARRDPDQRTEARRLLDRAAEQGVTVVSWNDSTYPQRLRALADPPPILFLRGRTALLDRGGVAVVGARRAPARAREVASRLGRGLARAEVPVWSGLALGVDGAAHEGCLAADGDTVAVLGSGIDVVYPRRHRWLFDAIGERGLLLSEFAPGTGATPWSFPRRNRILAALSDVVVVVAAGKKSGALITVDHALDVGTDVWTVPGPVGDPAFTGSNRLLVDGARPLVSIRDFCASMREAIGGTAPAGGAPPAPARAGVTEVDRQASLDEERILRALGDTTRSLDELVGLLGIEVATASALLTTLELFGEIERLPDARYRRAA